MRIICALLFVLSLSGCAAPTVEQPCTGSLVRYCKPHIYFSQNSNQLVVREKQNLEWAYQKLLTWPQKRALIVGYADALETSDRMEGLRLAEMRAISVKQYLQKRGIDPSRLTIKFKDQSGQTCDNPTCYQVDRQVIIDIYNPKHWWIF